MLHIAICDDAEKAVQVHTEIAEECLRQFQSVGEIATYTQSDNSLDDISEDHFFFDLILLDIEMPKRSGMELAEKIFSDPSLLFGGLHLSELQIQIAPSILYLMASIYIERVIRHWNRRFGFYRRRRELFAFLLLCFFFHAT